MDMLMSFSKGSGAATVAFDELSATLCISPDQRKREEKCFHSMCSKAPQHQLYAALPPCPQANMVEPSE